jgi:hypothetical protein
MPRSSEPNPLFLAKALPCVNTDLVQGATMPWLVRCVSLTPKLVNYPANFPESTGGAWRRKVV